MKTKILLLTALFALVALAMACGNSPANSNNAVKPANTVASTPIVVSTANSAPVNTSPGNKMSGTPATSMAGNKPPMSTGAPNPAAADEPMNKVATTKKPPKGATAVCKDGTYSFSKTDAGQCSGHGGVDKKF